MMSQVGNCKKLFALCSLFLVLCSLTGCKDKGKDPESLFGNAARIVIRHYDRESFAGGDIYRDFCAACGIPWDGTYQGKDVKQGTYFVLVKAKGADGQTYNIRKDVNLLRGYTYGTSNSQ